MMKKNFYIQNLCFIGVFTAIISITAQISIPLPFGIPMTMQSFAVMMAGIILGEKRGSMATLLYLLIGFCGFPVFSNFTGGYQVLIGPAGGYLLSFPILAYLSGIGIRLHIRFRGMLVFLLVFGNTLNLFLGAIIFCLITQSTFLAGVTTGVVPFIPATLIKIILAYILGLNIRKRLIKMIPNK